MPALSTKPAFISSNFLESLPSSGSGRTNNMIKLWAHNLCTSHLVLGSYYSFKMVTIHSCKAPARSFTVQECELRDVQSGLLPVIKGVINPYKWPHKWVTGIVTPISGVIAIPITGRAHFAVKSPELSTHSITTLQRRHNLIRLNLKIPSFHVNHHANLSKIAPSP